MIASLPDVTGERWLLSPDYVRDPYPFYAALRETQPVWFSEAFNAWLLTRYEDVVMGHSDDRFVAAYEQSQRTRMGEDVSDQDYFRFAREFLITNDPPLHTRLRRILRQPYTPRRVAESRRENQRLVNECIDGFVEAGRVDVISGYAAPVPLSMVSALLGVPREDEQEICSWLAAFGTARMVEPMTPEQLQGANASASAARDYFVALVHERRARPRDDFPSELLAANAADEDPLTDEQISANLFLLYFAGFHTQSLMFGNIVMALSEHPDAQRWLAEDPSRVPDAMNELYRYDAAGQFTGRTLTDDVELHGQTLCAGDNVLLGVGSANRDPDAFADPDALHLTRGASGGDVLRQLTFGLGRHYCIGAHLAHSNLELMLEALLTRIPTFEVVAGEASRIVHSQARGFDRLSLAWNPADAS